MALKVKVPLGVHTLPTLCRIWILYHPMQTLMYGSVLPLKQMVFNIMNTFLSTLTTSFVYPKTPPTSRTLFLILPFSIGLKMLLFPNVTLVFKLTNIICMSLTWIPGACLLTLTSKRLSLLLKHVSSPDYHPELNQSDFLVPDTTTLYQSYIGIIYWAIELGRIDPAHTGATIAKFMAVRAQAILLPSFALLPTLRNILTPNVCLIPFLATGVILTWPALIGKNSTLMLPKPFLLTLQLRVVTLFRLTYFVMLPTLQALLQDVRLLVLLSSSMGPPSNGIPNVKIPLNPRRSALNLLPSKLLFQWTTPCAANYACLGFPLMALPMLFVITIALSPTLHVPNLFHRKITIRLPITRSANLLPPTLSVLNTNPVLLLMPLFSQSGSLPLKTCIVANVWCGVSFKAFFAFTPWGDKVLYSLLPHLSPWGDCFLLVLYRASY